MAIVISILKVIGIILLIILALILVLLAVLLFLPLRYQLYGETEPTWYGRIKIGGFSGFFSFVAQYQNEEFFMKVSALWGLLQLYPPREKKQKKSKEETSDKSGKIKTGQPDSNETKSNEAVINQSKFNQVESTDEDVVLQESNRKESMLQETVTPDSKKQTFKKLFKKKKTKTTAKKKQGFRELRDNINKEENKRAVLFIIEKALWLLKKVKPTIAMAEIDYCMGDPALTGQLTGILSMCPSVYGKHKRITPDFVSDDIYVKGKIKLTGRIFMVHIVLIALQLFHNKDCRQLFGIKEKRKQTNRSK